MIVGIVGSRSFQGYDLLKKELSSFQISKVVSGGAKGADALAARYAKENNIPLKEFLADWEKFGRSAGPIRNQEIVNDSQMIIAFWDGKSRGTKSTIDMARKKGLEVKIVYF